MLPITDWSIHGVGIIMVKGRHGQEEVKNSYSISTGTLGLASPSSSSCMYILVILVALENG